MVSVDEAIQPFIPMLNRGLPLDDVLLPIMAENPSLDREEVIASLESHISPIVRQVIPVPKAEKPKLNGSRYRESMSRRQYEKTMTHLQDILNVVSDRPNGVRKSTILRELRKENSHWRPKITRWLHDLVEDGLILSDGFGNGTLYYPPNVQVQDRERKYHRLVAESLQEWRNDHDSINSKGWDVMEEVIVIKCVKHFKTWLTKVGLNLLTGVVGYGIYEGWNSRFALASRLGRG